MKAPCIPLIVLLAFAAGSAQAATTEAIANATVQPGGVRTGSSGINFFNVEGADYGSFASYGVVRFDLSSLKASFDAEFGTGGWRVDHIALELTQSNASFTTNGNVEVLFTGNDAVSLTAPSPLTYDNVAIHFTDLQSLLGYTFTEVSSGTVERHTLFDRSLSQGAGALALLGDVGADNRVTLLLREAETSVAATYAGFNNSTHAGPTLDISVSAVPEPETYAMLLAGLGLIGFAARRRG